ncbi:MAG TPA: hypothetical protein VIZ31_09600 [Vicinamibacteria bacterium]
MKDVARALALTLLLPALSGAQAPPKPAPNQPITAAYYYRVKWGFQEEFERLFLKNHYPVLKAEMAASGPIQSVLLYRPMFHGDGRADWTYLVVITYKSWEAMNRPREEGLLKRLYPDQATFEREEQRRFEILDAHWDMPLTAVEPPK